MARKPRLGQRGNWRFSDAGNRFDGRQNRRRHNDIAAISPTLKRGVIYCTRCGSRVVSNTDHCPFCGRDLRPVYARLWFWLIVVVVVAVTVFWVVRVNLPEISTSPTGPATPAPPQVIGAAENSSLKNLALGTGIDNSGLEVTVVAVDAVQMAANGAQVYLVTVDFVNASDATVTLYSAQWLLEDSAAVRQETFVGQDLDANTIASNFVHRDLAPGEHFQGLLYFAIAPAEASAEELAAGLEPDPIIPAYVIYQPSPLTYSEDLLVSWWCAD